MTNKETPAVNGMMGQRVFQENTYGGLTYQIHILGEVNKPGTYRVTASTRLSEALERAGNVLARGSERRIELRRREGGNRRVDLLDFKQFGNLEENPYLLDNDVIYVPLKGDVVQIAGAVKRSGTYEILKEKTLAGTLKLAGGLSPGASLEAPIKVIRFTDGKKELIDVKGDEEAKHSFHIQDADVIVVPHFITKNKKFDYNLASLPGDSPLFYPSFEERVFVLGAVNKPGAYPYTPFYNLRQYLTLAGGTNKLSKSRKISVIDSQGNKYKGSYDKDLNPGDTIIVPEKYLPPEGILSLILGVTTSVLGITTTILTLSR